ITAATSGAAAVCTGIVAIFNWRSNWVRFLRTAELLKAERVLFDTRTSPAYAAPVTAEQALQTFVTRIEATAARETGAWGAEALRAPQHPAGDDHGEAQASHAGPTA